MARQLRRYKGLGWRPEGRRYVTHFIVSFLRFLAQFPRVRAYAPAAEACSTGCFAGASASSATPITTSTAEPIKKPTLSLGM